MRCFYAGSHLFELFFLVEAARQIKFDGKIRTIFSP
jgi:hypothetical protein